MSDLASTSAAKGRGWVRLALIAFTVGTLLVVGWALADTEDGLRFAIASGVVGSLVASFIWAVLNSRKLGAHDRVLDRLFALQQALELREMYGLRRIDSKYAYKPDYWHDLAANPSERFWLLGFSLRTWLEPEYEDEFFASVDRFVRRGGDFCMIIADPDGEGCARALTASGRDHKTDIERMLTAMAKMRKGLPKKHRANLDVRLLRSDLEPKYMGIVTDRSVEFTPFLMAHSGKDNFHASFEVKTAFAAAMKSDFKSIRNHLSRPAFPSAQHPDPEDDAQ